MVIPGWSAGPDPESRDSRLNAEPVIGPRFARTRWHTPQRMTTRKPPCPPVFQHHRPVSALDAIKACRDAALKQRPVEAEREPHIAALDHLIGLLRRARHAADRHAAFENAGLGARHQRLHLGGVNAAA